MKLSPHFTLEEMIFSQTAARAGIDNTPSPMVIAALTTLCVEVLEPVRAHFARPVRVTSGYRSPAVNVAIGGSRTSQHCLGEAADIVVPGVSTIDLAQWIMRNLRYDQLIYEFGNWVHVSYRKGRLRHAELTARRVGGEVQYLSGIRV